MPADQAAPDKSDLWKLELDDDFNVPSGTCIKKGDIEAIAIEESNNDGWRIDSVITILRSGNNYEVATQDMDVDQWVDGEGNPGSQPGVTVRFQLNKII